MLTERIAFRFHFLSIALDCGVALRARSLVAFLSNGVFAISQFAGREIRTVSNEKGKVMTKKSMQIVYVTMCHHGYKSRIIRSNLVHHRKY